MSFNESNLAAGYDAVWLDANRYYEAERRHYEISLDEFHKRANPGHSPAKCITVNGMSQSSLASEIAIAREKIQNFLKSTDKEWDRDNNNSGFQKRFERFEYECTSMKQCIERLSCEMKDVLTRIASIEKLLVDQDKHPKVPLKENPKSCIQNGSSAANEDDDIDLFGSDEEDDAAAAKLREERLQAYANKKSKKPALVAKSSVVLDVKPWDDETDMVAMEKAVREIQTDGLVWGASKLVPLAYGIKKLQIVAIVEDEKVSIDWLQETISEIEDLVQSVDIAAFNKL